jgi:hypothetical protein
MNKRCLYLLPMALALLTACGPSPQERGTHVIGPLGEQQAAQPEEAEKQPEYEPVELVGDTVRYYEGDPNLTSHIVAPYIDSIRRGFRGDQFGPFEVDRRLSARTGEMYVDPDVYGDEYREKLKQLSGADTLFLFRGPQSRFDIVRTAQQFIMTEALRDKLNIAEYNWIPDSISAYELDLRSDVRLGMFEFDKSFAENFKALDPNLTLPTRPGVTPRYLHIFCHVNTCMNVFLEFKEDKLVRVFTETSRGCTGGATPEALRALPKAP